MPFDDEYPLEPVDAEEEPGYGEPWEDRDIDVKDLMYLGAEVDADTIRDLVEEQVETWRRVPNLVVEAEGRKGYGADASAALHGYWKVSPDEYGPANETMPGVYVDCATGELVSASYIRTPPIPRDEVQEAVMDLLEANGDKLPREEIEAELAPQYDADEVDEAINLMQTGLSFGLDSEIVVERPDVSPASDHLVERLAAGHPAGLDAEKAVEQLEERASQISSTVYDDEDREEWRETVREQLDLGPVFTRD